jgi:hypothetical protein
VTKTEHPRTAETDMAARGHYRWVSPERGEFLAEHLRALVLET